MSGWIEWNHRRAGRVVEKAGHDGHHVSQRSDAKEGIIGARKRIFVGKKGMLPTRTVIRGDTRLLPFRVVERGLATRDIATR